MKPSPDTLGDSTGSDASPERIRLLSRDLARNFDGALTKIDSINLKTRLLSFNAQIESARAGEFGSSFSVVASEMRMLSRTTDEVVRLMEKETMSTVNELNGISEIMANNVRGTRLSDMALVNIDLVDRNLFERTCDVRWWATDSAMVDALSSPDEKSQAYACKRLGVILDAYTVYYDLVLCDLEGNVVANGRPQTYRSIGSNVSDTQWFRAARQSSSGNEYGFESVKSDGLVDGKLTLSYSCSVRENGSADGRILGVLGILFDWESLAQEIVKTTPIDADHKACTRCCLIDDQGNVLADSHDKILVEKIDLPDLPSLKQEKKTFTKETFAGVEKYVGYAFSPGYETYSTGWHSVIIQSVNNTNN